MADTKEHAHELIDRLPPTQLSAVVGLLEAILDPVSRSLANAPWTMSRPLRKKPAKLPLLVPPSTVAKAFLTSKFSPSLASSSMISSAWAAPRSTPTKRSSEHRQERYLERQGQGPTPRHRSTLCPPYPSRAGPLSGHRRRRRQAPTGDRASRVPRRHLPRPLP